jgi:PAS domain-containing protein
MIKESLQTSAVAYNSRNNMDERHEQIVSRFANSESSPGLKLLHAFFSVFKAQDAFSPNNRRSYWKLAQPLVFGMHVMSLVLPSDDVVKGYASGLWFFGPFNYFRIDGLAWNLGIQSAVSALALALIFLPALAAGLLTYMELSRREVSLFISGILRMIAVLPLKAYREILLVPMTCILISMIKYGVYSGHPGEYVNGDQAQLSPVYTILGVIALPIFLAEVYIATGLIFEISFVNYKTSWFARPHSYVQLRAIIVVVVMCGLRFTSDVVSPQFSLGISALMLGYLTILHVFYLPYYFDWSNTLYTSMYASVISTALAHLLAIHFGSAAIVIQISLWMFPCYLYLSHNLVARQISINKAKLIRDCRSPYEAITVIKYVLFKDISAEDEDEEKVGLLQRNHEASEAQDRLREMFIALNRHSSETSITDVWESLYFCFREGNPTLAQLKLTKLNVTRSFTCAFLVYQLSSYYDSITEGEDITYLKWLKQTVQVKEDDKNACLQLVRVYDLLIASKSDANAVSDYLIPTYRLLQRTKKAYKHLIQHFIKRPEVLKLYGHFMADVLNDMSGLQAQSFTKNEANRLRNLANMTRISLFDNIGVLVVGVSQDDLGIILYANQEAASLLGLNISQVIGAELNNFIPPPYSLGHNQKLSEFLQFGATNHILRSHIMLYTSQKHIIEVSFDLKILAFDSTPYILVAIQGKPGDRELAVYDDRGCITSCTQHFKAQYGTDIRLEGINLEQLFPGIWDKREAFPDYVPFMLRCEDKMLVMAFSNTMMRVTKIKFVYVLNSYAALEEIEEGKKVDPNYHECIEAVKTHFGASFKAHNRAVPEESKKVIFVRKSVDLGKVGTEIVPETDAVITSNASSANSAARITRYKKLRDYTVTKGRRVRVIIVVAFLLVLGTMIGLSETISYFVSQISSISTIRELGGRRALSVKIAAEARTLELIELGLSTDSREESIATLEDLIDKFEYAENIAEDERNDGHHLGKDEIVPVWEWQPEITLNLVTGREAVKRLLFRARQLTSSTTREAALYGIRNGVGETLYFLNRTLFELIEEEVKNRFSLITLVAFAMTGGLVVVLLVYIAVLAPSIYFLESNNHSSYDQLKAIPREAIMDARLKILDRLELVHGIEALTGERDRIKPTMYKQIWPKLALKFCLFVTATFAVLIAAFLIYIYQLNDLLLSNLPYTNWAGMRRVSTVSTVFWCRELLLSLDGNDYLNLIQEDQVFYSYQERIMNSTATLDWASRVISQQIASAGVKTIGKSSKQTDMMHGSYPSNSIELNYGIQSGILEFLALVADFTSTPTSEGLIKVKSLSASLFAAFEDIMIEHQDYINEKVDSTRTALMLMILAYGVTLFVLLFYYSWVISTTSVKIISLARLLPMLPEARPINEEKQSHDSY